MAVGLVGEHTHVGGYCDILNFAEQVGVDVQFHAGGVEGINQAHVVVGEGGERVARRRTLQVETALTGEDVLLVDIDHGIFGQAPHALAHVAVVAVGTVGGVNALCANRERRQII